MWRALRLLCAAALLILGTATATRAGTIYTYTGPDFTSFTNPGMLPTGLVGISGSVTLSTALGDNFSGIVTPVAFSFTDGVTTITQLNEASQFDSFYFATNSSGAIVNWYVELCAVGPGCVTPVDYFETINTPTSSIDDYTFYINGTGDWGSAESSGSPGAWVTTPEPSALVMLGSGLLGLIGVSRRKIRS